MPQTRRHRLLPLALAALLASALPTLAQAGDDDAPPPSMAELLDASSPADWRSLDPENTVYLELDAGRVIIELAPDFAPAHAENVRTLARGYFWDGLSVYRSHDNFVVQWGDPESGDARRPIGAARDALPAEFERDAQGVAFTRLPGRFADRILPAGDQELLLLFLDVENAVHERIADDRRMARDLF